jgi:hypothetical protein
MVETVLAWDREPLFLVFPVMPAVVSVTAFRPVFGWHLRRRVEWTSGIDVDAARWQAHGSRADRDPERR